jgi:hypothetical protein
MIRDTLGVMAFNKENTIISSNIMEAEVNKLANVTAVPPYVPTVTTTTTNPTSTANSSPDSITSNGILGPIDSIITQQPSPTNISDNSNSILEYPADMTGFLNGLSEGLSNVIPIYRTNSNVVSLVITTI